MPRSKKFNRQTFNRVRRLANQLDLSVSLRILPDKDGTRPGGWTSKKKIIVNNNSQLSWSKKIHVLLHEIGHHLYDLTLSSEELSLVDRTYLMLSNQVLNPEELRTVLQTEHQAWVAAQKLAEDNNIPTSKRMFQKLEQEGIEFYKGSLQ